MSIGDPEDALRNLHLRFSLSLYRIDDVAVAAATLAVAVDGDDVEIR